MSDFKSKLPDLNELASMAEKFFKDMKNSVSEIIESYNQKHHQEKTADKEKNNKEFDFIIIKHNGKLRYNQPSGNCQSE